MNGVSGHEHQIARTEGVKEIISKDPSMKVILESTANWDRAEAMKLMENWLQSGKKIDVVVANNDEMAMGAIMAIEAAGKLDDILVAGIDATPDALEFVKDDKLEVTVFQDAKGQAHLVLEVAIDAINGKKLEKMNWVPYQVVTKENVDEYIKKWQ